MENSCPIQGDIGLQQCADICFNSTDCRSFNHTDLGTKSSCNLHNYRDHTVLVPKCDSNLCETEFVNYTYTYGWATPKLGVTVCKKSTF